MTWKLRCLHVMMFQKNMRFTSCGSIGLWYRGRATANYGIYRTVQKSHSRLFFSSILPNNKQHHQHGISVIYAIHAPKLSSPTICLSLAAQKNRGKQLGKLLNFHNLAFFSCFFLCPKTENVNRCKILNFLPCFLGSQTNREKKVKKTGEKKE